MATDERRTRPSLEFSYRYFEDLEQGKHSPELFKLVTSLQTVQARLSLSRSERFKGTKQLWRSVQRALFDTLIQSFPGYMVVTNVEGESLQPKTPFPEEGGIKFCPNGCRRTTDVFEMEIKSLMPNTRLHLANAWRSKGSRIGPEDFLDPVSQMKQSIRRPLLGEQLLKEETAIGHTLAESEWQDLHRKVDQLQDGTERQHLLECMSDLEAVWGNLCH